MNDKSSDVKKVESRFESHQIDPLQAACKEGLPELTIGDSWRFDASEIQAGIGTAKRGDEGATTNEEGRE